MELREYWEIIRRRWWLPAALTLAALVASTVVALQGSAAYRTEMRLAVSTIPVLDRASALYYDPVYYANLSAEYLADDLTGLIPSEAFAVDVSRELGYGLPPAAIASVTRARKTHRWVDVTITTPDLNQGQAIGEAMVRVLNDPARASSAMTAMAAYRGQVSIVSSPVTQRGASSIGLATEIGLRTVVGLFLGLALAFLLDYLDQSVRGRRDVERDLALPVLGEIPRARRGALA